MHVHLTEIWVHDAANLSDWTRFRAHQIVEHTSTDARRQRYAGGRLVHISRPGHTSDLTFRCHRAPRAAVDALRQAITGQRRVMVRDTRGRIIWGRILRVDLDEGRGRDEVVGLEVTVEQSGAQSPEV